MSVYFQVMTKTEHVRIVSKTDYRIVKCEDIHLILTLQLCQSLIEADRYLGTHILTIIA
jgi:hypothetical protein